MVAVLLYRAERHLQYLLPLFRIVLNQVFVNSEQVVRILLEHDQPVCV